jgi:transcription elongation factor Elf1
MSSAQPATIDEDIEAKIQLLEALRRGQEPLWDDPGRGFTPDFLTSEEFKALQEMSVVQDTPMSYYLDDSQYNLGLLKNALATLMFEVNEMEIDEGLDPIKLVSDLKGVLPELLRNVLRVDPNYFEALSVKLGVSPVVLSMVGGALIQPSMIFLASQCEQRLLDAWNHINCPVCDRQTSVVLKSEGEVWRFKCQYCLAEYWMDIFTCPSCGSKGLDDKEFLLVGESQALEIVSCNACSSYYKIINNAKIETPISEGLEEVYTGHLDEIAQGKGLRRLDEAAPRSED